MGSDMYKARSREIVRHSCHATCGPFSYKMGIMLFTVVFVILNGRLYAFLDLDFLFKHMADDNIFFYGAT